MKKTEVAARPPVLSRRAALGVIAAGTAWLHGCGGGGGGDAADIGSGGTGVAGVSSGGTGSFTTGTVSGLGSIIVRGVRFDDSHAVVTRRDDAPVDTLRPGMVVAIHAGAIVPPAGDTLGSAIADRISYASEWVGTIEAVDAAGSAFTLLGQRVEVTAAAVIEGAATALAGLSAGQFVEVHGYLDVGATRLVATRIDVSATAPAAYRLSGQVQSLDLAGRTCRIGSALVTFDSSVALPAGFADGMAVRLTLGTSQVGGAWPARRVRVRESAVADVQAADQDRASVEGTVTGVLSSTSFSVDGIAVDASGVAGVAALALGALVQVKGSLRSGAVVASEVEVKPRTLLGTAEYRFIGPVSNLDVLARTFTLQGQSFTYGIDLLVAVPGWLTGGTPTVEVRALRAGGSWLATEIKGAS